MKVTMIEWFCADCGTVEVSFAPPMACQSCDCEDFEVIEDELEDENER